MADADDETRITLRLPARLRDELTLAASKSGRSMNGEIIDRLVRSLNFEQEYGDFEQVMRSVWDDIEDIKGKVSILWAEYRGVDPYNVDK